MIKKEKVISTFARRIGRGLREGQKELLNSFLPKIKVSAPQEVLKLSQANPSVSLEIGFGNGEFLLKYAIKNPDNIAIGCEPYLNGVASILRHIKNETIENIRILPDDVNLILDSEDVCLFDNVFIICPDPWPKRKQNKRRLINSAFIKRLHDKLKENGNLHIVTDHTQYAEWILSVLADSKFSPLKQQTLDKYVLKEDDWLFTKYQRKGILANSRIYYFKMVKNS